MKHPGDVTRTHAHRRQRGSVYLAVLGASTIVFIVGAAAMLGVRLQNATTTLDAEVTAAQQHAVAAIDLGRWWMTFVPGWRADSGASVSNQIPFGSGAMALNLSDPIDNDLADS